MGRFEMRAAFALRIISGKIIYNFAFVALCGALQTPFHGRGRNGKQHLQRRCGKRTLSGSLRSQAVTERVHPLFAKKITGSGKAGRLKPKIRTNACFTVLKTYKTAKKFSLFLVRLLGGLRLLCGQNLLL